TGGGNWASEGSKFRVIKFNFSTPFTLTNGTKYVVVFENNNGTVSNQALIAVDASSPGHSGNLVYNTGSWNSDNTADTIFYTFTNTNTLDPGTFTSNTEQWVAFTVGIPDAQTTYPYVTGYGIKDGSNISSLTRSINIPFDHSTLLVGVSAYDDAAVADTELVSLTYNGVSLTPLQQEELVGTPDGTSTYLYAIPNLSAGTHDLVATFTSSVLVASMHFCVMANADTAHAVDASNVTDISSADPKNASLTTLINNSRVWSFYDGDGSANSGSGSDMFETGWSSPGFYVSNYSKTIKATAGSVTHQYTNGSADSPSIYMASVSPYVSVVTRIPRYGFIDHMNPGID
ncbi:MAG TPA: hypothetical protein VHA74_02260, partial [Candidatus Dojkabacteria bacterium]|nr:hypothetical protein [Candidatus Dojkabacteria bacterium]